jgi:hypothetical protein
VHGRFGRELVGWHRFEELYEGGDVEGGWGKWAKVVRMGVGFLGESFWCEVRGRTVVVDATIAGGVRDEEKRKVVVVRIAIYGVGM